MIECRKGFDHDKIFAAVENALSSYHPEWNISNEHLKKGVTRAVKISWEYIYISHFNDNFQIYNDSLNLLEIIPTDGLNIWLQSYHSSRISVFIYMAVIFVPY